jgi:hypothetical protein
MQLERIVCSRKFLSELAGFTSGGGNSRQIGPVRGSSEPPKKLAKAIAAGRPLRGHINSLCIVAE